MRKNRAASSCLGSPFCDGRSDASYSYLGQKPIWNWLTANTAVANTAGMRQAEHKDSNYDHPKCPYYFIANIPLCDFTVENGATEFWLGSHVSTTVEDQQTAPQDGLFSNKMYKRGDHIPWIHEEAKLAQKVVRPPMQPEALRGDIMIRDLRTWHAGMPNNSDKHRIMLGLGYQVGPPPARGSTSSRGQAVADATALESFSPEFQAASTPASLAARVSAGSGEKSGRGEGQLLRG